MEDVQSVITIISFVFATILFVIGYRKWMDFESNRIFNNFSNKSKFAYELYQKTKNPDLENIGYEFGVAAFTGNVNLTPLQRKRLLAVVDPIKSMVSYKRCSQYVHLEEEGLTLFSWKEKKYTYSAYRNILKVVCIGVYILAFVSIPLIPSYAYLFNPAMLKPLESLPLVKFVFGVVFYVCELGFIGYFTLAKAAKIIAAEKLIENNVKASEVILNTKKTSLARY